MAHAPEEPDRARLRQALPLVDLADVGHVCKLEAPEVFNQTVRRFLHDHVGSR